MGLARGRAARAALHDQDLAPVRLAQHNNVRIMWRELDEERRRVPQRRIIQTGRVPPEAVQLDDVVPRQ